MSLTPQARWNERNQSTVKAATERLERRNRLIVAEELHRRGGTCVFDGCEKTKVEWHHRDPATKTISIGSSVKKHSARRLLAELALCDPYCRRHHMVVDGRLERARAHLGFARAPRTCAKPGSKLTEEQVREIRARKARGESNRALAQAFGVVPSLISNIIRGKTWAWLSD